MTEHCGQCGSRKCNHGACPECNPCRHCDGGYRGDKFFGYDEDGNDRTEPRYARTSTVKHGD